MQPKPLSPRKQLSRWSGWFFFWNTLLILLIGVSYLPALLGYFQMPLLNFFGKFWGIFFVTLAFVGQSALLAFMEGVLAYLVIQCSPKRGVAVSVSIALASVLMVILVVDAITYHLYHYHLGSLVWNIITSGAFAQVIELSPLEWLIFVSIVVGTIALESLIAYGVWRYQQNHIPKKRGRIAVLTLGACLFFSYAIYFSAGYVTTHPEKVSLQEQVDEHLIVTEAQAIPYYFNVLNLMNTNDGIYTQNSQYSQALHYPLQAIQAKIPVKPYNIVIIAIDTWRYDMMNSQVTPHIAAFANQAIDFTDNYSGGNSTQPGIFSLFYSLPSPYWSAMLNQHQGPLFIQQLLKEHYQLGIFGSAELIFPPFDKTVFRDVPNLQIYTPGNTPAERDMNITKEFNSFVNHRNLSKPFFGFLFYDAVHGYCGVASEYPQPFQPAVSDCDRVLLANDTNPLPYINRYKNAVLYDDALIGQVLENLKSHDLLKNTIVIITADHGEEFNDEHLDYWGHASAFDPYQLRTPLIVYWPGIKPEMIYYQTSHYDIVPTLMQKALGVMTLTANYSVGHSLFSDQTPPYLIVGNYLNYAILQPDQTTVIYPGGDYNITYPDGYDLPNAKLDPLLMQSVYEKLNRYYR